MNEVYFACARGCGKSYAQFRRMLELMVNGEIPVCNELKPYISLLKGETNMNKYIYKKEIIKPVMDEHIKKIKICEPKVDFICNDLDKVMATLQKDIYAKVVNLTDKAICDAIIDFAKNEGLTDVFLIDETFVVDAFRNKQERVELREENKKLREELAHRDKQNEELFKEVKRLEHMEPQRDGARCAARELRLKLDKMEKLNERCIKEIDELETSLKDSEERNNVKDALIDDLHKEIYDLNNVINEISAVGNKLEADKKYIYKIYKDQEAELDKAHIQLRNQGDIIKKLNDSIKKYEVMKQTLEALCGVEIDV